MYNCFCRFQNKSRIFLSVDMFLHMFLCNALYMQQCKHHTSLCVYVDNHYCN